MLKKIFLSAILVTVLILGCETGDGGSPDDNDGDGGNFKVGDTGPGGGVIFYYSKAGFTLYESATDTVGTTCNYLEAASVDMPSPLAWGSAENLTVTGTSNGLGMGMKNTALILAKDPNAPAAKACNEYSSTTVTGGWYLPSREELDILYKSGKGNFVRTRDDATWKDCYWSSSQEFDIGAWYTRFSTGDVINEYQNNQYSVRAIRAFPDAVPIDVVPEEIRDQFEKDMPIYDGYTPPDIAGQYLANQIKLIGSSIKGEIPDNTNWADMYVAFIKASNGRLTYREKQGNSSAGSDDVFVQIVGSGNNFTAYFVAEGVVSGTQNGVPYSVKTKMSTVISGTLTTNGISNFHYAFVMVEKGPDPNNRVVPVNTYRIFKDGDGTATRNNWYN